MKRLLSGILAAAVLLSALVVGASAADREPPTDIGDEYLATEKGWIGFEEASKRDNEGNRTWRVKKYIGTDVTVVIPSSYIGKDDNTSRLVTEIAATAFQGTGADTIDKLKNLTIPGGVEKLAEGTFANMVSLETVTFLDYAEYTEEGNGTKGEIISNFSSIGTNNDTTGVFEGCGMLSTVILPNSVGTIGKNAFKNCRSLSEIVFPKGLTRIHDTAFSGCASLRSVIFLGVGTQLGASVFPWKSISVVHCPDGAISDDVLAKIGPDKEDKAKVHKFDVSAYKETANFPSAPCKSGGKVTVAFSCPGTEEIVTTEIKDEDGNVIDTNTETIKHPCTELDGKGAFSQTRDIAPLPHTVEIDDAEPATDCQHPEMSEGSHCSVCDEKFVVPVKGDPGPHKYTDPSKVVEKTLFAGHCDDENAKGLVLVTRQCEVCGYTPVCWECQKYEWDLTKANEELKKAEEDYEEASAGLKAAEDALEKATEAETAARTAANEAATALSTATTDHGNKMTAEQTAQNELNDLEALGTATAEQLAEAQKKLDEAKEAAEKARLALMDATIAKDAADEALEKATKAKGDAQQAVTNAGTPDDTEKNAKLAAVKNCETALKTHVEATDHEECSECAKLRQEIETASGNAKATAIETYEEELTKHDTDHTAYIKEIPSDPDKVITGKTTDAPGHTPGPSHTVIVDSAGNECERPACGTTEICYEQEVYTCLICGAPGVVEGSKKPILTPSDHTPDPNAEFEVVKEATCTEDGQKKYAAGVKCVTCGADIPTGKPIVIPKKGHDYVDMPEEITKEPTCTEEGEKTSGLRYCKRDDCPLRTGPDEPYVNDDNKEVEKIRPAGHTWIPAPGQDVIQAEDCHEKTITGSAVCEVCGEKTEGVPIVIPGKMGHTWGEWKASEDGKTETRTCSVCGKTETRDVTTPPTPPDDPDDPDNPDDPKPPVEDPDGPFTITVTYGEGGTASVSKTSAKRGESITVSVTANSGYELDMIRVITTTTAQDLTGGRRTFTMPAANVEVRVSFQQSGTAAGWGGVTNGNSTSGAITQIQVPVQITPVSAPQASAWEQLFNDVPVNHWAAGEINWANQMGYMSGYNGRFNPNDDISSQQVWMVLARLMGNDPASMTEASRWAMKNGVATGSDPAAPITRWRVVVGLYRVAVLTGRASRPTNLTLAGYLDSTLVPASARDAMIWAVSNGIVTSDSENRLNPAQKLSRAEFAVLLYRYSQRV